MIYSVDTSVILDTLLPDSVHGVSSKEILNKASRDGTLVICPIVYAELCLQFDTRLPLDTFIKETGIQLVPFTREVLWKGGEVWKDYVSRGGKRKDRIIPDFLIGAFSSLKAQAIITRNRDFYRDHFQIKVYYP